MEFREDYAELLRTCLAEAEDWHSVESCFQGHIDGEKQEELENARPVVYAFGYMLVSSRRDDARERYGVFGALWEMDGSVFPAPLADIPNDMLDVWSAYAVATQDHPLAVSRLNDLLWVRRYRDPAIHHARAAFDGYLALADSIESMERVDSLLRAIEIATEIKDERRLTAAIQKAVAVIEAEIANQDERRPGIPMNLLEALVDLKPDARPSELERLLEAVGQRYGQDPHVAQSVSELRVALSSADERVALQREQVERWTKEAERTTGLLRYAHLKEALGLARTYGFTDLAERILIALQSMTEDDLELKSVSSEIKVPTAEIDQYVKSYVKGAESWEEALTRFGGIGPPSGDVHKNKELIEELAEEHPLQRLFRSQVIGAHSSPTLDATTQEEHERLDLAKQEALSIGMWGHIGVEILEVIEETFGVPTRDELIDFFTTELVDGAVASRIADAVLRFFEGDEDGSLHILIPQIEAAIRGAAARIGIVVIKTPRGASPGGVRALGALLADFAGRMDESWRRYLLSALADPLGVNLRNQLSHGLYGPAARSDAAVAIQIACYLRLWRPGNETDRGGTEEDD